MIEKNISNGWAGSNLILFNLDRVFSTLDIRLQILLSLTNQPVSYSITSYWSSKTFTNIIEANSQHEFIKARIRNHQNSSPTKLLEAVDQMAKGTVGVMHQITFLRTEVSTVYQTNITLSRRRQAKRIRIPIIIPFSIQDIKDLLNQQAIDK